MESMQLLARLSLFPAVFALPAEAQAALRAEYAHNCVACMACAHAVMQAQGTQVRGGAGGRRRGALSTDGAPLIIV